MKKIGLGFVLGPFHFHIDKSLFETLFKIDFFERHFRSETPNNHSLNDARNMHKVNRVSLILH